MEQRLLHRLMQKTATSMRNYQMSTTYISIKVKFNPHLSFNAESACSATNYTLALIQSIETIWRQ
jgi:hypothetical protein